MIRDLVGSQPLITEQLAVEICTPTCMTLVSRAPREDVLLYAASHGRWDARQLSPL